MHESPVYIPFAVCLNAMECYDICDLFSGFILQYALIILLVFAEEINLNIQHTIYIQVYYSKMGLPSRTVKVIWKCFLNFPSFRTGTIGNMMNINAQQNSC